MSTAKISIFVSDVADPCGIWRGTGRATVFDCNGVFNWPCGRFRPAGATAWRPVPNGSYRNLPFRCGHLQVEVPPGCYWVIAGHVTPGSNFIHLNYTTHVGIVQVGCGQDACVKLYNPGVRPCWNWFLAGLKVMAARALPRIPDDLLGPRMLRGGCSRLLRGFQSRGPDADRPVMAARATDRDDASSQSQSR